MHMWNNHSVDQTVGSWACSLHFPVNPFIRVNIYPGPGEGGLLPISESAFPHNISKGPYLPGVGRAVRGGG
jgi:hypothetical protein